jgi:hypothetical protein
MSFSLSRVALGAAVAIACAAADPVYDFIASQANATLAQLNGALAYPTNGQAGRYGWTTGKPSGWTSGFFPGTLLNLYNKTGDSFWLDQGRRLTYGLASERFDTSTHDVGFIMYTSFGKLWSLAKDATAREYLITTADSLSTRFSSTVGCVRSWNSPAPTFEVRGLPALRSQPRGFAPPCNSPPSAALRWFARLSSPPHCLCAGGLPASSRPSPLTLPRFLPASTIGEGYRG